MEFQSDMKQLETLDMDFVSGKESNDPTAAQYNEAEETLLLIILVVLANFILFVLRNNILFCFGLNNQKQEDNERLSAKISRWTQIYRTVLCFKVITTFLVFLLVSNIHMPCPEKKFGVIFHALILFILTAPVHVISSQKNRYTMLMIFFSLFTLQIILFWTLTDLTSGYIMTDGIDARLCVYSFLALFFVPLVLLSWESVYHNKKERK